MNPLINSNSNNDFISRFKKFRQSFSGDPQQQVQQLLNSGKVSQEQYNAAVQKAQQLSRILNLK